MSDTLRALLGVKYEATIEKVTDAIAGFTNGRRERLWLSPECITAHQDVLDFREASA